MLAKKGKDFWGSPAWTTLHSFAAAYRPEKRQSFLNFVKAFPDLLPCDECGEHFRLNLQRIPVENYMKTNSELFFWTYLLHDLVNQQISKHKPASQRKRSPPFDEVKDYYFRALSNDCQVCSTLR